MGCVKVILTPFGGIACKFSSIDGINASVNPIGGIDARAERIGIIGVNAKRIGGIFCRVYRTCSSSIRIPYLEISPTIVWVIAGQTQNDVYSNTYWNIN